MPQVPYTDDRYKIPERSSAGGTELFNVPNYGELIGRGLNQFGSGMEAMSTVAQRMQQQDDITATQNAMNSFRTHVRNVQYGDPNTPDDAGFFGLENKAALDAWQPTTQKLDQTRRSLMAGLSPEQQRLFQQESEPFQNSALESMANHTSRQRQNYQQQTEQATLDNLTNQGAANLDNHAVFAGSLNQGRQTVMQSLALNGVPLDSPIAQQKLQNFNDAYFTQAAQTARDSDDAIKAQNLLISNRNNISAPVFEHSMAELKPHIDHQVGRMLADGAINHHDDGMAIPAQSDQDTVFTTMTHLESGGRQTDKNGAPLTSSKGATGVAQLMPDTARSVAQSSGLGWDEERFKHDSAYNRALGSAYYDQLCQKYSGNLTLACAAYNAGPGRVDQRLKDIGDPRNGAITDQQFAQNIPFKETRDYVSRTGESLTQSAPVARYAPPDINKQIADVHARARAIGASPEAEEQARAHINKNHAIWEAETHEARTQLTNSVNDLSASYMAGNTKSDIPESQIRTLYPPETAQKMVDELSIRRNAGIAFSSLKYASPQQVANYIQETNTQRHDEDISHFKVRQQSINYVLNSFKQRTEALQKDPVAYTRDNPDVQKAYQAYQSQQTPENFRAYAEKMDAVQSNMGVIDTHLLTNDEAGHIVGALTQIDPQKQDIGPTLFAMKNHYGATQWPRILSELRDHNLPASMAVLADMDTAQQANGREVMQRAQRMKPEELNRMAGPSLVKQLDDTSAYNPLETKLWDMKQSYMLEKGGATKYSNLYEAMKLQVKAYVAKGVDPSQAYTRARDDIFGAKYDTSGHLRPPKGELSITKQAGDAFLASFHDEDVQDIKPPDTKKDGSPENKTLRNARTIGQWIRNDEKDGYNLAIESSTTPGAYQVLKDKDDNVILLSRADILSGRFFSPYDYQNQRDARLAREHKSRHLAIGLSGFAQE